MSALERQAECSSLEEEQKRIQNKISLSNCGVCGSEKAKYRCPACLTHSCSLLCVKKHKDDSGCSGVRNKTAFVALSHFDEMALLSDYRFLEDTGRFSDGASRDSLVRVPRTTLKLKLLASQARKMNITLRFLPLTFTKRRENSTVFNPREKMFLWHLKLIFPQSSSEFSQRRVPDRHTLKQILTTYIHPTESDPVTRQKLKMYVNASSENVKVFMKAEGRKANSVRYHELDTEKSLKDNLSFKMLIEYPVLHVVLRDQWKDYPLKGPGYQMYSALKIQTLPVSLPFPRFQKHCIMSSFYPAEDLSLSAALFFTMATHYPNGNEHVLFSITYTNLTSTASMAKKRIKHGVLCNNDLMTVEPTDDEETDHCVVFTRLHVCAEPASACTGLATKNVGIDGQKRAVDHVSPPSVQIGTNLQTAAEEISPESEPPLQKRAKRGVEEEEQEEGEILDSSDEEEMLERNQAESIPLENNTSVNDMKNIQHGVN